MKAIRMGVILVALSVYGYAAGVSTGWAQTQPAPPSSADAAQAAKQAGIWRTANEHAIIAELRELLSIPNVASDTVNILRNADALKTMLERRGVRVRFLPIPGRGPVIFGELLAEAGSNQAGATARTVIFYAHYDGQPVDPAKWTSGGPFTPTLWTRAIAAGGQKIEFPAPGAKYHDDWRIYARSASDDKSPIIALLAAVDALRAAKVPRRVNIKFLLDGEEEAGSPNLAATLEAHRDLLKADVLITCDGPVHQSGIPLVNFGNRGVMDVEITVYGPVRALHSGHYGNWAPNPAMRLAQLLASMKDASGRVLIDGYYDDVVPLSQRERHAIAEIPPNDADLKQELQLGGSDGSGKRLDELIQLPSLNIRGLRSAYVGEQSQNIIPTEATASIDMRLVKNCTPEKMFERLVAHIRKQGYHVASGEPTREERLAHDRIARVHFGGGYPATRISMDLPASLAVVRAVEQAAAGPVVKSPTSGGSVPMHIFERFGLPVIGVPIVNHDNSQHSHNENVRIGNLWRGIELYAALMADLRW